MEAEAAPTSRDVELIDDPESELTRLTGRGNKHPYAGADSVRMAEAIRRTGPLPVGSSASYERFLAMVGEIR